MYEQEPPRLTATVDTLTAADLDTIDNVIPRCPACYTTAHHDGRLIRAPGPTWQLPRPHLAARPTSSKRLIGTSRSP